MGKQNLEEKKMYLRELSGSKFHSVNSSNVILYNEVKNSIFIKSGFIWLWNWALQFLSQYRHHLKDAYQHSRGRSIAPFQEHPKFQLQNGSKKHQQGLATFRNPFLFNL